MNTNISRRPERLETAGKPDLPFHQWTRTQLCNFLAPDGHNPTRAELQAIIDGTELGSITQ